MKKGDKQKLEGLQQASVRFTEMLQTVLQDEQQFYRYVYSAKSAESPQEAVLHKADIKAIKEMASVLKEMTFVVRGLYGLEAAPDASDRTHREETEHGIVILG